MFKLKQKSQYVFRYRYIDILSTLKRAYLIHGRSWIIFAETERFNDRFGSAERHHVRTGGP